MIVSKQHGANPTIPICFYCGKDKNEIVLLGKLPKDKKAPMRCLLDYIPCSECQKKMDNGVTLIETAKTPVVNGQPPIAGNEYPTGKWAVVSEDYICNNIKNSEMRNNILKKKMAFLEEGVLDKITGNKV